jgi:hypothetical protein
MNSIMPESMIDEITKKMAELEAEWAKPKPEDPSLPQIPGYSHYMDLTLHKIEKAPPLLTDEDQRFTPVTFTEDRLTERINWYKNQVFESVTQFLLSQHPEDFNRITDLEIREVGETSNGSAEDLHKLNQVNYMFLRKLWDPSDIHLYVSWKAKYKYLVKKEKRDDVKMSDLTLGPEGYSEGSASVKSVKAESRGSKKEEGEIVISFPVKEYENLTQSIAIDYVAALNLSGLKLKAEIDGSYITQEGVVLWGDSSKGNPVFLINYYKPAMSEVAIKKAESLAKSNTAKIEDMKKEADKVYSETINSAKGIYAQLREELKLYFSDLKSECTKLSNVAGDFAKQVAKLPAMSIVTTPTGPGVAVNVIFGVTNILKSFANLMTSSITTIENLMKKLQFEKFSSWIPSLKDIYKSTKSLLALAKVEISVVEKLI